MKEIKDKSIDLILADLPYALTACKWDIPIDLDSLWIQYKRIIKDNGVIALFGSQPFTAKLIMSNLKMFKYEWIWEKEQGSNYLSVNKVPYKVHENILIFYNKNRYYPQMTIGKSYNNKHKKGDTGECYRYTKTSIKTNVKTRYPRSIQQFKTEKTHHSTQKPVPLLQYLIKTYTNENDLILDNVMGSGSTIIAALLLKRKSIGIEKDNKIFNTAKKRIKEHIDNNIFS